MASIDNYFDEEMRYLYDEGKNFAKAFPRNASFLNIDSVDDRDPYIERLFEGVAFLTAGIREKLDKTLPELTGGVVELLWPGLRADFPSVTIVEFKSKVSSVNCTMELSENSEIITGAVGVNNEICRFKTTQTIAFHPITLADIVMKEQVNGKVKLTFKFNVDEGAEFDKIDLKKLNFYIHGEEQEALAIHYYLTTTPAYASIKFGGITSTVFEKKPVEYTGFSKAEALNKDYRDSLQNMNTLKEYFYYPEKFRFVNLTGFGNISFEEVQPKTFEYELILDKKPPVGINISIEKFRMYCSPAINLFIDESEAINDFGKKREYLLNPSSGKRGSARIHSIISVSGKEKESGAVIKYQPYYSYKERTGNTLFQYSYRHSDKFGKDIYLSLIRPKLTGKKRIRKETVVAKVRCSNGVLPRDVVREGGIVTPGRDFPDYVLPYNITRPSQPAEGLADNKSLWVFQTMITSVFNSLGNVERLKSFLSIFNNSENRLGIGKIEAIEKASVSTIEKLVDSIPLRGFQLIVTIKESSFSGVGDLNMFGLVLSNFIEGFVSINSFATLKFNLYPSGRELKFTSIRGGKWSV